MSFEALPNELLISHIFNHLSVAEASALGTTNQRYKTLFNSRDYWLAQSMKRWPAETQWAQSLGHVVGLHFFRERYNVRKHGEINASLTQTHPFPGDFIANAVVINADRVLVTGFNDGLTLLDFAGGAHAQQLADIKNISESLLVALDGQVFFLKNLGKRKSVLHTVSLTGEMADIEFKLPRKLRFTPLQLTTLGACLAVCCADNKIRIFNPTSGRLERVLNLQSLPSRIFEGSQICAKGDKFFIFSSRERRLWVLDTTKATYKASPLQGTVVGVSDEAAYIFTYRSRGSLSVINVDTGECRNLAIAGVREVELPPLSQPGVCVAHNKHFFAATFPDGTVGVWKYPSFESISSLILSERCTSLLVMDSMIIVGTEKGNIHLLNPHTGRLERTLTNEQDAGEVKQIRLEGNNVIVQRAADILVWDFTVHHLGLRVSRNFEAVL